MSLRRNHSWTRCLSIFSPSSPPSRSFPWPPAAGREAASPSQEINAEHSLGQKKIVWDLNSHCRCRQRVGWRMSEQRSKASGTYCAGNSPWGGAVFIPAGLRRRTGESSFLISSPVWTVLRVWPHSEWSSLQEWWKNSKKVADAKTPLMWWSDGGRCYKVNTCKPPCLGRTVLRDAHNGLDAFLFSP